MLGEVAASATDAKLVAAAAVSLTEALFDEAANVRWEAGSALERIAAKIKDQQTLDSAVSGLAAAQQDPDGRVRRSAAGALGRIDMPQARAAAAAYGKQPSPEVVGVIAESTFDADDEGWTAVGTVELSHEAQSGHPGGCVAGTDTWGWSYPGWQAPPKFLGDLSPAYGGTLDFEQTELVVPGQYDSQDVVLVGGGLKLVFGASYDPRPGWTSYSVPLHESADWRRNSVDGPPATREDLLTVLSDLKALRIRGDYPDGWDECGLDNVVLTSGPRDQ